jgi:2-methylcitrate dehydratase PrpD
MARSRSLVSMETRRLSKYMAGAPKRRLPAAVVEKAKHHILDTFAAMVSGSRLWAGGMGIKYVKSLGGPREAGVVGSRIVTRAANAALANGISAHSDETDDSNPPSGIHPGAPIVSAALAAAEHAHGSGEIFLRAVVLGYDVGCRSTQVLGVANLKKVRRSTHGYGGTFGAGAAAGAFQQFDAQQCRYLLSYCAQLASGCGAYMHDEGHLQKAYVFGGNPGYSGVSAAAMVAAGFTGPDDVFTGERNFLDAYSPAPNRAAFVEGLGKLYEIMRTSIKKWTVGSPIQSVLDSVVALVAKHGITVADIKAITVSLSPEKAGTADDRPFPDVNLQHLVSMILIDGGLTFASCHDRARLSDPRIGKLRKRIRIVSTPALSDNTFTHQAVVAITLRDGRMVEQYTQAVRGTRHNPMDRGEVVAKAHDLIDDILGAKQAKKLVNTVFALEAVDDMSCIRPLLAAKTPEILVR